MRANLPVAALIRFREGANYVIALPCSLALRLVENLIREIAQQPRILLAPQQNAVRGISVAPSASCLLVILLDRLGQRQMHHGAHCRLVDAEAESDGADQYAHFVRHPQFLIAAAIL